ncbi:TylF/MycF/NovP-related O-methyltransferase [Halegenticoccus tardaugens]|uniref:TylF/MycF/NovP-related O-methyltransferase n=1 Tax=Halegenticoccus tardaugens TaxID=2071624 RepID=UPI00100BB1A8|nr:TylF/MycF/NovP-related O-methyltransferase [Halegenticoccus tardaugens]
MERSGRNAVATLAKLYRLALLVLSTPVVLGEYFARETGAAYGVGFTKKCELAGRMLLNNTRIPTGSSFVEHLIIATQILNLPPERDGVVVECGCYMGGSTANLSLAAGACDRKLVVFDSFEGMPEPTDVDRAHVLIGSKEVHTYDEGSWRGSLGTVRRNVTAYGDVSACEFRKGYFEETMADFDEPVALAFLDVGLRRSAETCLEHLWPLLDREGYLFTHDVKHMEIASLFFDAEWWREHLDCDAPGVVGAGSGVGLHPKTNGFGSLLGYTVKEPELRSFTRVEEDGAETYRVGASDDD